MIVGLDIGRNEVKLVTGGNKDSFPSALADWRKIYLQNEWGKDDMDVTWNGKRYFVGRIAQQECDGAGSLQTSSKVHNDTLLLGLCALHLACPDNARIQLVTGLPVNRYTKEERALMRGLFLGQHELQVNGITKQLHIETVSVVPETASAYFSFPDESDVRVIDLGSRTTGYAQILNKQFRDRMSGTLDYGANNFQGTRAGYLRYVINELSMRWDFNERIYLIGGLADYAFPAFKQVMPNVHVAPEPLYTNALAYYRMGVKRYGTQQQTMQAQG